MGDLMSYFWCFSIVWVNPWGFLGEGMVPDPKTKNLWGASEKAQMIQFISLLWGNGSGP